MSAEILVVDAPTGEVQGMRIRLRRVGRIVADVQHVEHRVCARVREAHWAFVGLREYGFDGVRNFPCIVGAVLAKLAGRRAAELLTERRRLLVGQGVGVASNLECDGLHCRVSLP